MKSLEDGIANLMNSEQYMNFLKTMSIFHGYSLNNTILIMLQRPDASLVAGYKKWQSIGRQVKKGEKSITILCPCSTKRMEKLLDENGKPVLDENGKEKKFLFLIFVREMSLMFPKRWESLLKRLVRRI